MENGVRRLFAISEFATFLISERTHIYMASPIHVWHIMKRRRNHLGQTSICVCERLMPGDCMGTRRTGLPAKNLPPTTCVQMANSELRTIIIVYKNRKRKSVAHHRRHISCSNEEKKKKRKQRTNAMRTRHPIKSTPLASNWP